MIAYDNVRRTTFARSMVMTLLILSVFACNRQSPPPVTIGESDADIVFVSYRLESKGWLYLIDTNSKREAQIQGTNASTPDPPAWSPDGQALAFVAIPFYKDSEESDYECGIGITIIDAQGHLRAFGPCRLSPAWSSDGQYLAFRKFSTKDNSSSICVARINGSDEKELVTNLPYYSEGNRISTIRISWSPDGRYLVYDNQDVSGTWHIWTVASDGGPPHRLTSGRYPDWSPLGDEIAFSRDGRIVVISVNDGSEDSVNVPVYARWPDWSPDGQQLVFVGDRGEDSEIYIVNRDGSEVEKLTDNSYWDGYPAWRPARLNAD